MKISYHKKVLAGLFLLLLPFIPWPYPVKLDLQTRKNVLRHAVNSIKNQTPVLIYSRYEENIFYEIIKESDNLFRDTAIEFDSCGKDYDLLAKDLGMVEPDLNNPEKNKVFLYFEPSLSLADSFCYLICDLNHKITSYQEYRIYVFKSLFLEYYLYYFVNDVLR